LELPAALLLAALLLPFLALYYAITAISDLCFRMLTLLLRRSREPFTPLTGQEIQFLTDERFLINATVVADGSLTAESLREMVGRRWLGCDVYGRLKHPRLHCAVQRRLWKLGWVQSDAMDMDHHVVKVPIGDAQEDGGEGENGALTKRELEGWINRVAGTPFGRGRPAWQVLVLEGVTIVDHDEAELRVKPSSVVLLRFHHSIVDGIALFQMLLPALLDPQSAAVASYTAPSPQPTGTSPTPTLADTITTYVMAPLVTLVYYLCDAQKQLSFDTPGARRSARSRDHRMTCTLPLSISLNEAKRVKTLLGGGGGGGKGKQKKRGAKLTLNDLMVSCLSGAYVRYAEKVQRGTSGWRLDSGATKEFVSLPLPMAPAAAADGRGERMEVETASVRTDPEEVFPATATATPSSTLSPAITFHEEDTIATYAPAITLPPPAPPTPPPTPAEPADNADNGDCSCSPSLSDDEKKPVAIVGHAPHATVMGKLGICMPKNTRTGPPSTIGNQWSCNLLNIPTCPGHSAADRARAVSVRLHRFFNRQPLLGRSADLGAFGYLPMVERVTLVVEGVLFAMPTWLSGLFVRELFECVSCAISNVAGPPQLAPLFLSPVVCGVKSVFFHVPFRYGMGVGVSVLSANDTLQIAVMSDPAVLADPHLLLRCFEEEYEAVKREVGL